MNMQDTLSKITGSLARPTFFVGLFVAASLLAGVPAASAETTVSGTITSDTTWTAAEGPYVVNGLTIENGVTLTVEAGTVVKVAYRSGVTVRGALDANGEPGARVVFTSVRDDSAGGDTNGDGSATSPAPGDWRTIDVEGLGILHLTLADVRYGGYFYYNDRAAAVYLGGGTVNMDGASVSSNLNSAVRQAGGVLNAVGSSVSSSYYGLYLEGGAASLSGCSLSGVSNRAVYAFSGLDSLSLTGCSFTGNGSVGTVYGAVGFTHSGSSASGNGLNGFEMSGALAADAYWVADLPYVLSGFSVPAGVTLTLGPGAVVKDPGMTVAGRLVADGTPEARVTITSRKDDSAGGDTNGDGSATAPAKGDWGAIRLPAGASAELRHADVRYGGRHYNSWDPMSSLLVEGGSLLLDRSSVSQSSNYGVHVTSGTAAVTGSSFSGNSSYGVYNSTASAVDARGNWWGSATGPRHASNPAGAGDRVSDNVLFEPFLDCDPTVPGACEPSGPSLSNLRQLDGDSVEVAEGGTVKGAGLTLSADLASPSGAPVRLEVEVKPLGVPFDGTGIAATEYQTYEGTFTVPVKAYLDVDYHWRARASYEGGAASEWAEFGAPGNADFTEFTRTVRVGVVMVDLQDKSHVSATIGPVQPCKLIDAKQYAGGHTPDYYADMMACVRSYHQENSYDKIALEFTYYDNGGAWYGIPYDSGDFSTPNDADVLAKHRLMVNAALGALGQQPDADVYVVVHAGGSWQSSHDGARTSASVDAVRQRASVIMSEHDTVGTVAHEFGHLLLNLNSEPRQWSVVPDLYDLGHVDGWDLMAEGGGNGAPPGSDPPHMGAYSKLFSGLLVSQVRDLNQLSDREYTATSRLGYGGEITAFRTGAGDDSPYYLVEARTKDPSVSLWDRSVPSDGDGGLVFYYVRTSPTLTVDIPGNSFWQDLAYGGRAVLDPSSNPTFIDYDSNLVFTATGESMASDPYWIRASVVRETDGQIAARNTRALKGVVLKASLTLKELADWLDDEIGLQPRDPADEIEKTLDFLGANSITGIDRIISVENHYPDPDASSSAFFWSLRLLFLSMLALVGLAVARRKAGRTVRRHERAFAVVRKSARVVLVLSAVSLLVSGVFFCDRLSGWGAFDYPGMTVDGAVHEFLTGRSGFASDGGPEADLDLHVFCDDGRHVGVNYATGEYEVGVEGAITNGDNVGAPEWIFFPPEGNGSCRHSVSARDNEAFLAANPDIAAQIPDPADSYDIYARAIDPATGILTSATLSAQAIEPGETVAHALSLAADGTPAVALGVVDLAPPVTSASLSGAEGDNGWFLGPVTVTLAADDADGSGVASTEYSTDGGLNWAAYAGPFEIAGDGAHAVMFGSRDGAGNSEATGSVTFTVAAPSPLFCPELGQQVAYSPDFFQPADCQVPAAPGKAVLLDSRCAPVAGARVNLRRADGSYVTYLRTGADGAADFSAHIGGQGSLFEFDYNGAAYRTAAGSLPTGAVARTAPMALKLVGSGCGPIPAARVNLRRADGSYVTYARTDAEGVARFESLPGAGMRLEADFNGATWTSDPSAPGALVTLGADRFALSLLSSSGSPIPAARVNLLRADGSYVTYARTGADGVASFDVLPGASMRLEADFNGAQYMTQPSAGHAPETVRTLPLGLRLLSSSGAPVAAARVNLRRADGSYVTYARTGADGVASFDVLPGTGMRLEADYNGATWTTYPVTVDEATELAVSALPLSLALTGSSGSPIPGARVNLRRADGSYVTYALTDGAGTATFDVLPNAAMRLEATHNGASFTTGAVTVDEATALAVRALPLSLALAGSDGSPIANARVNLRRADSSYVAYALTGADGVASFDVLPGAGMRLEADFNGATYMTDAATVTTATSVPVQAVTLAVSLTSAGQPLANQRVDLLRADASYVTYLRTGEDGTAEFQVLPGSTHQLRSTYGGAAWISGPAPCPASVEHGF
jgi:M6 family metalloprotease-like protein